ncbi:hypothetical protein PRIEUP_LOCUS8384, partial [Pristimantis euphronides]
GREKRRRSGPEKRRRSGPENRRRSGPGREEGDQGREKEGDQGREKRRRSGPGEKKEIRAGRKGGDQGREKRRRSGPGEKKEIRAGRKEGDQGREKRRRSGPGEKKEIRAGRKKGDQGREKRRRSGPGEKKEIRAGRKEGDQGREKRRRSGPGEKKEIRAGRKEGDQGREKRRRSGPGEKKEIRAGRKEGDQGREKRRRSGPGDSSLSASISHFSPGPNLPFPSWPRSPVIEGEIRAGRGGRIGPREKMENKVGREEGNRGRERRGRSGPGRKEEDRGCERRGRPGPGEKRETGAGREEGDQGRERRERSGPGEKREIGAGKALAPPQTTAGSPAAHTGGGTSSPPGGMCGAGASYSGSPAGAAGARCGGHSGPGHRPGGPGTAHSQQGVGAGAPPRGPSCPGALNYRPLPWRPGREESASAPQASRGEGGGLPTPPSPLLGRRAAVRSRAVGRPVMCWPGAASQSGYERSRERWESVPSAVPPAWRRSRGKTSRQRSSGSGRAARAQRESSDSVDNGDGSSAAETAAEVPGTSEEPSSADETIVEGRGGAAGGACRPLAARRHTRSPFQARPVSPARQGPTQRAKRLASVGSLMRGRRPPGLVWIVGHSYVYWGAQLADRRREGRQLGIGREITRVRWIGVRGMRWGRILGEVQRFVSLDGTPDIIVVHAGGNDIGKRPCRDIKYDILRLWKLYPKMVVVWSEIVKRKSWRNARSVEKLDKARIKVNRMVSAFVTRNGGVAVRHRELEAASVNYWRQDGVHLTEVGLAFWLLDIQEGVERAIAVWGASHS